MSIKKTGRFYSFLYWMMVFMMSDATSFLVLAGKLYSLLFLSKIVILLVSLPKPAPSSFNELSTIKSAFFFDNFLIAFSFSFSVSSAKPTSVWEPDFIFPDSQRMSFVFINSRENSPVSFFIFWALLFLGE